MRRAGGAWATQLRSRALALREDLLEWQVAAAELPLFAPGEAVRCRMAFSGRVQKVGFRREAALMARRLGLSGWVCNLPDGRVLLEAQGTPQRIRFLATFMGSLRRISIGTIRWCSLPPTEGAHGFLELR